MEAEIIADVALRVEVNEQTPVVRVCVYGTLRRGEGNHYLLDGKAEYLGTFTSEPEFTMWGRRAGFPILSDNGTTAITYEVWAITNPTVLDRLHALEGCTGIPGDVDNWYDIVAMKTPVGNAWIYLQHNYTSGFVGPISSGDWKHKSL